MSDGTPWSMSLDREIEPEIMFEARQRHHVVASDA